VSGRVRAVGPIFATVASGIIYGLCFPVASWQGVAWIALVPWLVALRHVGAGGALGLGWLWTITAAYTLGDWFAGAVASYYGQPIAVGVAFFVGVSSLMAAPYYMLFALCSRTLFRRSTSVTPLLVAAAWVAAEIARARVFAGNPWGLFGYTQMGRDELVQIADATSVYGISFVLAALNAAVAALVTALPAERRRAAGGLAIAGGVAIGVWSYGAWRLKTTDVAGGDTVRVAMVQGNLDVGTQWREDLYGQNLDVYLRLTRAAVAGHSPDVVFWPENALTFFLEDEEPYRRAIAHVLGPSDAELIVGGPRVEGERDQAYFNSIFLLAPTGEIRAVYDKQRLVPFAERFPFPGMRFLHRRFARLREFTPGAPRPPLPTRAGLAGVTICSEAMFPEIAAERVREGARYFVDPAHDTWLTPKFSAQQFDIVRLRAVEQRRFIVRASTSGPSAVVDTLGRVATRTAFFTQAVIGGTIALRDEVTLYNRVGDLFAGLCAVVALSAWVARSREV
jgi:apolipoprotein N-acyltransferase